MKYKVLNESRSDKFICHSRVARTFFSKVVGLRFKKSMPWDEGFTFRFPRSPLISSNKCIGGKFMRFGLDLVFMDEDHVVTHIGFLPTFMDGYTPPKNNPFTDEPLDIEYCLELNLGVAVEEKDIRTGDKLRYVEVV